MLEAAHRGLNLPVIDSNAARSSIGLLPRCYERWSRKRRFVVQITVALLIALLLAVHVALAGGGPENVALVVNSRSWASLAVANYYVQLRQIPPSNVIYLDWPESVDQASVEEFRDEILLPVLGTIDARQLTGQIDYLVYSSDFPSVVDFRADMGVTQLPEDVQTRASLTGLTYLWQLVKEKNAGYIAVDANKYMRRIASGETVPGSHGFRSWYGWGPNGELLESGGPQYLLSTMLAVTSGRGNSLSEVLSYLTRSARADGTDPKGTIYFTQTEDVRSKLRQPEFKAAVQALRSLGVDGEIVTAALPNGRQDVQGAVLGTSTIDWARSQARILPGAICEHLTSTGGVMTTSSRQTPLTELLRHGAAGSSGTVVEPFGIVDKFPSSFVQVHYARGCTLAESFYQAVHGPYQLLIVGDPLCRPWANIPTVSLGSQVPMEKLKGTIGTKPTGELSNGGRVERFELFVDGHRRTHCVAGETLSLDTTRFPDGYHELRIVALEDSVIESQGRLIIGLEFQNYDRSVELTGSAKNVSLDRSIRLAVNSPGASRIDVVRGEDVLGSVSGEAGELEIAANRLGLGSVPLQALAYHGTDATLAACSVPLVITVDPPTTLRGGAALSTLNLRPGLRLQIEKNPPVTILSTARNRWLADAGLKDSENYTLSGYLETADTDFYQFQVRHAGPLKLIVDRTVIYQSQQANLSETHYIPLHLGQGTHLFRAEGTCQMEPRLDLRFGRAGAVSLDQSTFYHRP